MKPEYWMQVCKLESLQKILRCESCNVFYSENLLKRSPTESRLPSSVRSVSNQSDSSVDVDSSQRERKAREKNGIISGNENIQRREA